MNVILDTERLYLREVTINDVKNIYELFNNDKNSDFIPNNITLEEASEWVRKFIISYQQEGLGMWACCLKDTNKFIGLVGIIVHMINDEEEFEIGMIIGHDYTRQGYATEALQGCIEYAFKELRVYRVISIRDNQNKIATAFLEKNGFEIDHETPWDDSSSTIYEFRNPKHKRNKYRLKKK